MGADKKVLITGATGGIGRLLVERLHDRYDLVQQGRTARTPEQEQVLRKVGLGDLTGLRALMDGIDTVIHLAGAASPESDWDAVLDANIEGTRNVLEAARLAGVRRVVYASSNHAFGMWDRLSQWPVYPSTPPRADSLYGVSKAFGEVLGKFYHDEFGLDFIALRIGWMSNDPLSTDDELLRAMWLSPRDAAQVFIRAVEADLRWGNFYAVSGNADRRWDITNTMLELGYRPEDDWTRHETEHVVEGGRPARPDWPHGS